jgi:hypothetical protein
MTYIEFKADIMERLWVVRCSKCASNAFAYGVMSLERKCTCHERCVCRHRFLMHHCCGLTYVFKCAGGPCSRVLCNVWCQQKLTGC